MDAGGGGRGQRGQVLGASNGLGSHVITRGSHQSILNRGGPSVATDGIGWQFWGMVYMPRS